ncbi:rhomboid family intramembrane serine protease [Flavobacterium sp. K77]|uniref:rhomboid family intramembrane serine protease n=1 Tax=Flavobacterium sp. K77 TaxID=2910676 RepID=UPI001F362987|nr:rhomboid family intramembrane serine protease [Flavobacterium sp. K77]MCF6142154.1 rhomboid family intramembrane serine protease [Flavobacterium sp. K77]
MDKDFRYTHKVFWFPFAFVFAIWLVYWLQIRFDFDFVENGILPRSFLGLQGVLFSPFIHADLEHLYNNTIPLIVLLAAIQFFYASQANKVIVLGILGSGLLTWLIGRSSYHIGASGLIYVLFSFIFFKGIQTRYYRLVALSLAIIVVYGGLVWYVFPMPDGIEGQSISWEGHLSGLLTGCFLAVSFATPKFKKTPKYEWEKPDYDPSEDKFMQRFDADGNFVNLPPIEELEIIDEQATSLSYFTSNALVVYHVKQKNELEPEQ